MRDSQLTVGQQIVAIGCNHQTAPIELREQLAIRDSAVPVFTRAVQEECSLPECAVLSTCNRTEIYAVGPEESHSRILGSLGRLHHLSYPDLLSHSYQLAGPEAVRHLFRVACGLDSMVLGEAQILAQVREAAERAASVRSSGPVLSALFRQAVTAGKRARTETSITRGAVSISHVAVQLARQIFSDLASCSALVLGAGEMSEITLDLLQKAGMKTSILISNRTPERARALAERFGGTGVPWQDFPQSLAASDIVIVSTSAPHPILTDEHLRAAMKARRGRAIFLIDLSLPRNVEPSVGNLPDVFLYNLDDLKEVARRNLDDRGREVERVERIIHDEMDRFFKWRGSLPVTPVVVELRERAEAIRGAEWDRLSGKLSHLPEKDRQLVEQFSRQLMNKLLHTPTVRLKELAHGESGERSAEVVRELFDLDPPAPETLEPTE